MLSVVNSGKFILTLQSTPPFVIESIFALALAVLLAVPLITNLQFYLEKPSKRKRDIKNFTIADGASNESNEINENHKETNENENSSETIRHAVVMHYPAPISIDTSSSSDLDPRIGTLSRRSVSTPNVRSNTDGDELFKNNNYEATVQRNDQRCAHEFVKKIKPRKDAMLDGSSSFVATNSELPIIDISTFNYNSYRHKLIEASLKKRYRECQPPGDVIFNSIHLNTTDSTLGVRLNEEYDHSFFDFVEEYYDATAGMSKKEMEFLHPLDHFLVRGGRKRETREKATGTTSRTGSQMGQCESMVDNKPIDRYTLDKNGNISKVKDQHFSGISSKQENESSRLTNTRRNFVEKGVTSADPNSRKPVSSIVKDAKDSINVNSKSSDELGSVYSETEKQPRNATSNHSRDSSEPPSRGRTATRKLLPWITGNPSVSFNRKYGSKTPETLDGPTKRKVRSSERPSAKFYSRTASPRPRSANFIGTSTKKSYQNSSELEEIVKGIENTVSKEKLTRSNGSEISSSTFATPLTSTLSSKISSRPSLKLYVPSKNNRYRRSTFENVTDGSGAKFKDKRNRAGEAKSMETTAEKESEKNVPRINYQDQVMVALNVDQSNSDNRSRKTTTSCTGDRTNSKSTSEGFDGAINKAEFWRGSALFRGNKERKSRYDISPKKETKRRLGAGLSNLDKTHELSRGNNSDRYSRDKTDRSRSAVESSDTLALATNVSRTEKENFREEILSKENDDITNAENFANEENINEELRLPGGDSKVGLAMRTSLKNYIKTLKQVLKEGGNVDMVDLASLSLKDAISPELESILSSSELKELQDLLNIAEIKSNLATKDVMVL